jgi:cytochrome c553
MFSRAAILALLVGAAVRVCGAVPAFFPADADRGRVLAVACLVCHALPNLPVGDPPIHPPRLAGQRKEAIFMALLAYQRGDRDSPIMRPLVAALSVQDMRDLGAYLAAEGPVRPPVPAGVGTWAHERTHTDCTACHGETGMGEMWGMPVIAGQHKDYLVHAIKDYRRGVRKDATMGSIAAKLSDQEIEDLADYYSRQSHLRPSE